MTPGLVLVAGGVLIIVSISYYRLEKQPYLIELAAFDVEGKPAKCDTSYLNLMKEKIRIGAVSHIGSAITVRSKDYEKYVEVVSRLKNITIVDSLSKTSPYLMTARNIFGINPHIVSIFLRVNADSCTVHSVEVVSSNAAEASFDTGPGLIDRISTMVVNAIDPYIAISTAAYDYRRLNWSREQTFIRIARGKDTIWYKNLAGVTYLQQSDLYDKDKNRKIIDKMNKSAIYWFEAALSEDKRFTPAIFNIQNINLYERGFTDEAYQEAIDELMRLHWRDNCSECITRAAQLRLARYNRYSESRTAYSRSHEDLRIARELLEWKVRNHGATRGDLTVLARLVEAQETSTYQEYLSTVARYSGPTRTPGVLDEPFAHIEPIRP